MTRFKRAFSKEKQEDKTSKPFDFLEKSTTSQEGRELADKLADAFFEGFNESREAKSDDEDGSSDHFKGLGGMAYTF